MLKTNKKSYGDFPVGTHVLVIAKKVDFIPFSRETGVVENNKGPDLGIIVRFDEPPIYEGGESLETFNFLPEHLKIIG